MVQMFFDHSSISNPYSNRSETRKSENDQYGTDDVFLMQLRNSSAYFTTVTPFRKPDERFLTLTDEAPFLVPVYNVCASNLQFPYLNPDPNDEGQTILDRVISGLWELRVIQQV